MPKATLYLGRLTAEHTSGEWSKDDVFMEVWEGPPNQQVKIARWPAGNGTVAMGDGGVVYTDVALNVEYASQVEIRVRERDSSSNDDADSTKLLARYNLDRRAAPSGTMSDDSGPNKTRYSLGYRLITNPIPTVRILGIKCEKQTDDIDGQTAHAITGALSACCDAASFVIDKSPRPRAKVIANAFDAAGAVLDGIGIVAGWLAKRIEGKDDVYLAHFTNSSASTDISARFFPKQNEPQTHPMEANDTVCFETRYQEYFRFPLDQEDVTIEFREHDAVGKDISICSVRIPRVTSDTDSRLNGPAVSVVADTYDLRGDGKDGVYHMCYSIGMEDWALPASADAQGEALPPENATGYSVPDLSACGTPIFYRLADSHHHGYLAATADGAAPQVGPPTAPFNPLQYDSYWNFERVSSTYEDFKLLNWKHRRYLTAAPDHTNVSLVPATAGDTPEQHWTMMDRVVSAVGSAEQIMPLVNAKRYLYSSDALVRLEELIGYGIPWLVHSMGTNIKYYTNKRLRLMHAATGEYLTVENNTLKLAAFDTSTTSTKQIFEPRQLPDGGYQLLWIANPTGDDASQMVLSYNTTLALEPFTGADTPARRWGIVEPANKAGSRLQSMLPEQGGASLYWRNGSFGLSSDVYGYDLWVAHFDEMWR